MSNTIIALASDHAGFEYKEQIRQNLQAQGYEVLDFGPYTPDSVDYPDHAHPLAQAILQGKAQQGILLCGSGNGVAITANKYAGIRAALCWLPELARLARQHNDANVLALPARYVSLEQAQEMVQAFLQTPFEGGRHAKRVEKIEIPSHKINA
jgi:ribose 5-phosphate isomerase B